MIYIIRHGQTEMNSRQVLQGRSDYALNSVVSRAGAFLEEIRNIEGNILISTHAIAMKGLLEYLTPESGGAYWSKYIGNCAIYTAENQNGRYSVPIELV